jgi:hypothetical protein
MTEPKLLTEAEARAIYIAATSPDDFNERLRERGLIAPVVTLIDRDAAAGLGFRLGVPDITGPRNQQEIAEHFARHRTAAEAASAATVAELVEALVDVAASLAAAISLLEKGGKAAKKAAPSDLMFEQMVRDYAASLERARAILARAEANEQVQP